MSVDTGTVTITELHTDNPADLEAAFDLDVAARKADIPDFPPVSRRHHVTALTVPRPAERRLHWLARAEGTVVGHLAVVLPTLDNRENAEVQLTVHPRYRRRGVGRALYGYAVRAAHAEGRRRLFGSTVEAIPNGPARDHAGSHFAGAVGAKAALVDIRRRLEVPTVDVAAHDDLLAQAWTRAEGYSLVYWSARTPEAYIDDVARLDGRLILDAPMGDLDWEPERVDAERVRTAEAWRERSGGRTYCTGARHDASGRLVAFTALECHDGVADHAWQQITLVDPDHRGHRLGTIVKIANLRYAVGAEPALRTIDTWNAQVNDHMIRINDAMGFRPIDAQVEWQIDL